MKGRTNVGGGKPEEEKTVTAGTSVIEVNPSSGKVMKKVTVNPTPTESKSVTPTTSELTVTPSEGKHLSQVVVGAVEDVTPEVTAQTPVITQIAENLGVTITTPSGTNKQILQGNNANLLDIKNNAKKEGVYAWKKQIYQESTISFASKTQGGGTNYFTVYVTTSNPDVKPTSNDLVDMTFRFTFSGSYYLITINSSNATLYRSDTGKTSYGSWTYDESTMLLKCTFSSYGFSADNSITNQSAKTISRLGLVSYVISDNQSDYPSGGMHTDGYYYTLLDIPTIEQMAYNQALLDMTEVTQ